MANLVPVTCKKCDCKYYVEAGADKRPCPGCVALKMKKAEAGREPVENEVIGSTWPVNDYAPDYSRVK